MKHSWIYYYYDTDSSEIAIITQTEKITNRVSLLLRQPSGHSESDFTEGPDQSTS